MGNDAKRVNIDPVHGRLFLRSKWLAVPALALFAALTIWQVARADSPFAPDPQYNLQNARIELRFDLDQRKVIGKVTHTLTALHDGLAQLDFDSAELTISSVRVNGKDAHFSTDAAKLHVNLDRPSKAGEKYDVAISYEGKPKKGLYFVLPDQDNPKQPKEVWTQGEAEETHFYLPIYDYPNNRTTTDTILTVPRDWLTVSNGKLVSVTDAPDGMKTWTWRQLEPISTYLISVVAGEFDQSKETWRNLPVDFNVPRGEADRIAPTFAHTRDMLTYFSDRFGVVYPWAKYDQTMVDQFVEGGMENVSATTLTERGLLHPALARESLEGSDGLTSHELTHQWFGDLVTCKDWANLWLNEGFATFGAQLWEEHEFGADNAAYSRWRSQAGWIRQGRLFTVPIVTRDFHDSMAYAGNIYGKAGLVLEMLREQLGDEAMFRGLQHYLEANRMQNVVTSDLMKALEESTHTNVDQFFDQWIYGAGAPQFAVSTSYDAGSSKLSVTVRQNQKLDGHVGLFTVPVQIAIGTANGTKTFPITVSKAEETFSFPADGPPLLVLFDKGDKILKSVEFHKSPAEWIYQLQHAEDVPDRAEAAQQLGALKNNAAVAAALSDAALHDPFWGVRVEALRALGRIGGGDAEKGVLAAVANSEPWVREVAVEQLGRFRDDAAVAPRLKDVFQSDPAYRVRSAALASLGQVKASGAMEILEAAARGDSPDDVLRRASLRAMGSLGDNKAVPTLLDWAAPGKPGLMRAAAVGSLGQLDKKNAAVESRLISYLDDSNFDIRVAVVFALGERDDSAAIAPLEALLNRSDVPQSLAPFIERQLTRLRHTGDQPAEPGT